MMKKIEELEKKLDTVQDHITLDQYKAVTYKFCHSQELADFINVQVSQIQKQPKGRRYSIEFKNECLAMYFTGPKLYKTKLMHTFCLPGPKTLMKLIQGIKMCPGLSNDELFQTLKMKVNTFKEENKLCVLCVDEMSIKANLFYNSGTDQVVGLEDCGQGDRIFKPAHNATVLMVRGIYSKWKQPLCYYFFHSTCPGGTLKK